MSNDPNQVPPSPEVPPVPPTPPAPEPTPTPDPIPYAPAGTIEMNPEARTMGMLCHLLSLTGYISVLGFVIGPLIVWLLKKDSMPFVNDQGKESLNFQITMLILTLICVALACLVVGFFLMPIVAIIHLVFAIIASVSANSGTYYRYPICIRLIK